MMPDIEKRFFRNFDWFIFALAIFLSIIGIMTIYSATRPVGFEEHPDFYIKQICWLLIGIGVLFFAVRFDYIWLGRLSLPIYIAGLVLLVAVLIAGKKGMGAQRWLSLGFISFQPSEFFRIIFVIMLSRYFCSVQENMGFFTIIKTFFILAFIPLLIIILQPDLGTAIILLALFVSLSLIKGLHKKIIVFFSIIAIISVPFIGDIFWKGLKDYQKNRLVAFLQPEADPAGIGYHINQSKVTIGSGGILGKGYLNGTQGPLRFLPERQTDFIFSVFAEEWGLIGSLLLIFLYLLVIFRGIDTALKAKDEFGRLLASGITFMLAIYTAINIGMTLGVMPVVGIPLPFMSYGGTALVSNFIAIGILINIRTRRFELFY